MYSAKHTADVEKIVQLIPDFVQHALVTLDMAVVICCPSSGKDFGRGGLNTHLWSFLTIYCISEACFRSWFQPLSLGLMDGIGSLRSPQE
jgi:hypothetical protein